MKFVKRTLSVALSLVLCLSMVLPSFAAMAFDKDTHVDKDTGCLKGYQDPDVTESESIRYDYFLESDITLDKTLVIGPGIDASIDLKGHKLQLNDTVKVEYTEDGLLANVEISNSTGETKEGSVIAVTGKNAKLTLNDTSEHGDGKITGGTGYMQNGQKRGGGVHISGGGSFTMKGGQISGNKAQYGGGVYILNGGTLAMNGGTIKDNIVEDYGGGAYSNGGMFNMTGGTIKTNRAREGGGAYIYNTTFNMTSGTIENNIAASVPGQNVGGGGVSNNRATFNMSGDATIKNNKASSEKSDGGGVNNFMTTFNMMGGVIEGNEAREGGGVRIVGGSFTRTGESRLENNTARKAGADIWTKNATLELGEGDWTVDTAENRESGANEKYELEESGSVILKFGYTEADDSDNVVPGDTDVNISDPDVPLGEDPDDATDETDDPGVEIDDPAVPLASGPVTRAEFIDYLWRHEGQPETDGVCTFTDVPEDHTYVLALAWAEQNKVAKAYDDGTFEPDELVTAAAVREFLGNFETVFGRQAVAASALTTLTGADDEAVLNCDEVLAEFFGA